MSSQIFLYSSGGRTLWVPRHTPSPSETKPVCMLTSATPMELSRSFYLFDYPVQVVDSAQMAAMNPNAKTPNEVIAAVNDFRRVCAEDQSFLLQRCYNPQSQSPSHSQHSQHSQHSPNPQPQNYGNNPMASISSSSLSGGVGGNPVMDNAALLAQLLQQQQQRQQQQQPQQQMAMLGGGSYPDMSANSYNRNSFGDDMGGNNNNFYGGRGGGRGGFRNGMYGNNANNNMPYGADMMMQQPQNPMMGGGYRNNNNNYGMDPNMMMYGGGNNNNMPYSRGGRGGRRDGQMYGNYGNPMQQQMMMGGGRRGGAMMMGNNMNNANNNMMNVPGQSRLAPNARHEAEPITIDVEIPQEIRKVYMNPQQQVVIATMPGPHMTVWLREHPIPTDTQDKKFVFGKNGVILMLKAAFDEVKSSKPVELFPKQICTHFFIYGYCSRANCFHEHHSEQQVRELIAARHVQLKAMTKAQRHQLIDEIEEKDRAGVAATEAQREEREKRRAEMMAEREARRQQRMHMRDPLGAPMPQMVYSMPSSQNNPSQDIVSDDDDDADVHNNDNNNKTNVDTPQLLGADKDALADAVAPVASSQNADAVAATDAGKTPASEALAKLGITDSDSDAEGQASDDDDDDDASSEGSDGEAVQEAEAKKKPAPAEQVEDEEEEQEEEVEEKPVAKKRGRPPAAKKSAKRAKN